MSEIHVIDENFVLCGIVAEYTSLRIRRSHYGVGEFEIHLHPRAKGADALAIDRIVFPSDAPEKAGIIEKIDRREAGDELVARGRMLKGVAARRVCVPGAGAEETYGYDRIQDTPERCMRHYVAANLTAPEDEKRRMPFLALEEEIGGGEVMPWEACYDPLDEVLEGIGRYADVGWDIVPDMAAKKFVFRVVPGRDLSDEGGGARRVTFAAALGNAQNASYSVDTKNEATTAYVGGGGEDEERMILAVGTDARGLSRREMWVEEVNRDDPDDLAFAGNRKLRERARREAVACRVQDGGGVRYGADWTLGDRVNVISGGYRMCARVTEIAESCEAGKISGLTVTFGDPPEGIAKIVKNIAKWRVD